MVCFDELLDVGVLTIQARDVAGIDGQLITPQHLHEQITDMSFLARADSPSYGRLAGWSIAKVPPMLLAC